MPVSTVTFKELYDDRCQNNKPFYWKPQSMRATPLEFQGDYGIEETVKRLIAAGLALEMPVGEFISAATKKDLPIPSDARDLLISNIGDEGVHFRAFKEAAKAYPVSDALMQEAEAVTKAWQEAPGHEIEKAEILEAGIFLCTLSVFRVVGGESLTTLSIQISKDEARHVATNRGVLPYLGIDPTKPRPELDKLRVETMNWLLEPLKVPANQYGFYRDMDFEFLKEQSDLLLSTGRSTDLEELTEGANYSPPFESRNAALY